MLYMLVVCSGTFCIPVESPGGFTLTHADCEARMMRIATLGADVRCYSEWPDEITPPEPVIAITR
jgi:hypothetical protein